MKKIICLVIWILVFPSAVWGESPSPEADLQSLEEVKGLLKSIEKNSDDLNKLNSALELDDKRALSATAQAETQEKAARFAPGTPCGDLKSLGGLKDCLFHTIKQYSGASDEIAKEL